MISKDIKGHLENLVGAITFEYNGYSCGIDPLSLNKFDMWCGDKSMTADSIEEVMTIKFFDGDALEDILKSATEFDC